MIVTNFIDGQWINSRYQSTIPITNPATGEKIGEMVESTLDDVDYAVKAAKKAQKEWTKVPAPSRADILLTVGQLLKERKETIAQLITKEMGKVIDEARGEVQEGIDMAFYMAGEGRRLFGETTMSELKDKFAMSVRAPIGVVGMITPWNFPIAIATWKSFPALVAGNTVVWKPSPETPFVAEALMKVFEDAGVPNGVVNLVTGSGSEVGNAIVEHPDVSVISFTGSNKTGSAIAEKCGKLLKKVSLEMGGKNAIIVLEDANLDLAVEGIIWSAFGTSGQRCTACSRVIVQESIKDKLQSKILKALSTVTIGNGIDETVKIGPVINKDALNKIHTYVQKGREEGAILLAGGYILSDDEYKNGSYYAPSVFTNVDQNMTIAQEEIFGPVLSIISAKDLADAIDINNSVKYGLSSSIYTNDIQKAFVAQRDLDTGIVYVNAGTSGAEIHLPFGGTKQTGNGHRDSGTAALDVYTEWKSIYIDYSGKLQRAQIDI